MTPRNASPRNRPTREQTRARVLAAAADAFSARGYGAASLEEIAASAGLTKGAIYSSFGSKDQLFFEVMKLRNANRFAAAERAATANPSAPGASVGDLLEQFSSDDPTWHLAFIQFWASVTDGGAEALTSEFAQQRVELRQRITDLLVREGYALDQARTLSVLILALSNGLAIERAISPDHSEGAFGYALERLQQPGTALAAL